MLKRQLLKFRVTGKLVNVFPKLSDGIEGLLRLEGETADLVVDEASHHLELHGSISGKIHVFKEIVVG